MKAFLSRTTLLQIFAGALASVILFAGLSSQAAPAAASKKIAVAPKAQKAAPATAIAKNAKFKKPAKVAGKSLRPSHRKATTTIAQLEQQTLEKQTAPAESALKVDAQTPVTDVKTSSRKSLVLAREQELRAGKGKSWSLPIAFETASTLHTDDSYERQAQTVLSVAPMYRFNANWRISASTLVYKEDVSPGDSGFDNTAVSLSYVKPLQNSMTWVSSGGVILPTNTKAREETSYQGAVRLSTGMNWDDLFLGSSLSYRATVSRNFHEFTQTNFGGFNMRENLSQSLDHSLPITERLSFSTSLSYSVGRTYLDDQRSKFYVGADLGWSFSKEFSASIGTSNEGNALKPNGSESNIEFYDDNSSVVKFGLSYVL